MDKLPQVKPDADIFCGTTQHGPKDDRRTGWACIRVEGGKVVHKKFGSTPGQDIKQARWEALKAATQEAAKLPPKEDGGPHHQHGEPEGNRPPRGRDQDGGNPPDRPGEGNLLPQLREDWEDDQESHIMIPLDDGLPMQG